MFDKFADYMYYLLISPLKKISKSRNQWYKLMKVLGKRFDDALDSIYLARDQTAVATCDPEMLQFHAEDRGITRYAGESDENFRIRITNYTEILKLGGTDEGVLLAVRSLGYHNVSKKTARDIGCPDRWAEFYIIIQMHVDEQHPIDLHILRKQVRKVKQVGAKDNYLFGYNALEIRKEKEMAFTAEYRMPLYYFGGLRLDGSWLLDGSRVLDAYDRAAHAWCKGELL